MEGFFVALHATAILPAILASTIFTVAFEVDVSDPAKSSDASLTTAFTQLQADWTSMQSDLQNVLTQSQGEVNAERFHELDRSRLQLIMRLQAVQPKLSAIAAEVWLRQ